MHVIYKLFLKYAYWFKFMLYIWFEIYLIICKIYYDKYKKIPYIETELNIKQNTKQCR